jgi:hypothetical protein
MRVAFMIVWIGLDKFRVEVGFAWEMRMGERGWLGEGWGIYASLGRLDASYGDYY